MRTTMDASWKVLVLSLSLLLLLLTVTAEKPESSPAEHHDGEHHDVEHHDDKHHDDEHHDGEHNSGEHHNGEHQSGEHHSGEHHNGEHHSGEHQNGEHHSGEHQNGEHHSGEHHNGEHHSGEHHSGEHHNGEHHSGEHHSGEHHSGEHHSGEHHSGEHHSAEHHSGGNHSAEHHSGEHHSGEHHSGEHHNGEHHSGEHHGGEHHSGEHHSGEHHSGEHHSVFPFEDKKYEATFDPTGAPDGGPIVTLTFTYAAATPVHAVWTWGMYDVGFDLSAVTGDHTWDRCVEEDEGGYTCSTTYQTTHERIVPVIVPRLAATSESGHLFQHVGFPSDLKDFHDVTEPTHFEYISPPIYHSPVTMPPAKVHFTRGECISIVWAWETDNAHNFKGVYRKVGHDFTREVLMGCEDNDEELPIHRENTVGRVDTELTITHGDGHHGYHYVVNMTVHYPTDEDKGLYIMEMRPAGLQSWLELMPIGYHCAYPHEPVFHMYKTEGQHTLLVFCQVESAHLTGVELYHDGERLSGNDHQTVVKGQTVSNARVVAFKTIPGGDRPWHSFDGTYKCVATTEDGAHHEHEEVYEFAASVCLQGYIHGYELKSQDPTREEGQETHEA